jgi:serine protease
MKSTQFGSIVLALAACFGQAGLGAGEIHVGQPFVFTGPEYMAGEIIVKFRPGVGESMIAELGLQAQTKVAYTSSFAGFRVLTFAQTIPAQEMVDRYKKNPNVEYAELNYIAHIYMLPNDPLYRPYQWHLDNSTGSGIEMERAWDLATGSGVVVAVIDTGVKRTGASDGVPASGGYDFVNNDADPDDDNGHGTHVAGTVAQKTNNGVGVAGVAFGCSIMPVKVMDSTGSGTHAALADGIYFATNNGANVINMSLGSPSPSVTMEDAVRYAYQKGVTIVCASGNEGSSQVGYPAAYDSYCIAVGATRFDEQVAYYSNTGSALDLTAPGGDLTIDQNGDGSGDGILQETCIEGSWGYRLFQGTSMAAPHVSGVAALIISKGIATTPDGVRNALQSTADDRGQPGWDPSYGWGIVNAYAALGGGAPSNQPPVASFTYTVTNLACSFDASGSSDSDGTITAYAWDFGDGATGSGVTASHTYAQAGTYTVSLTVTDDDNATDTASQSVTVTSPIPSNQPPVASFTYTVTNLACSFDASGSSDSDGTITAYAWNFGDGATASGVTASHTYAQAGTYTVSLTVTDDDNATDTASQSVTVTSPGRMLHVATTTGETQSREAGKFTLVTALARIEVVDEYGRPVQNATVTGKWKFAARNTATAVTDADGVAVLTSDEARGKNHLKFSLTVVDVEKPECCYDGEPCCCTIIWK